MHRSPKRMRAELNQWKCMMIVALWRKQALTYEILPKGQIFDKVVYLNFLERRVLPEVIKKNLDGRLYCKGSGFWIGACNRNH